MYEVKLKINWVIISQKIMEVLEKSVQTGEVKKANKLQLRTLMYQIPVSIKPVSMCLA